MPGPVINLDALSFDDVEENGYFTSRRASIGSRIGARDLGYNLTELPPGKAQCPFHSHHAEEEMFFILAGEGELRFGPDRYPLRAGDAVACPTGGPEVAHQIVNTGAATLRYLALSTVKPLEVCEYPDSQKISASAGAHGARTLRTIVRAEAGVDYYDRERTDGPAPRD